MPCYCKKRNSLTTLNIKHFQTTEKDLNALLMDKISREPFLWGVATSAFLSFEDPSCGLGHQDEILSEKPDVTDHYNL